jgi:hypothetical protein
MASLSADFCRKTRTVPIPVCSQRLHRPISKTRPFLAVWINQFGGFIWKANFLGACVGERRHAKRGKAKLSTADFNNHLKGMMVLAY